jgi:hypothetical protein
MKTWKGKQSIDHRTAMKQTTRLAGLWKWSWCPIKHLNRFRMSVAGVESASCFGSTNKLQDMSQFESSAWVDFQNDLRLYVTWNRCMSAQNIQSGHSRWSYPWRAYLGRPWPTCDIYWSSAIFVRIAWRCSEIGIPFTTESHISQIEPCANILRETTMTKITNLRTKKGDCWRGSVTKSRSVFVIIAWMISKLLLSA